MPYCLDDIASDMSVFHRVNDITALDGPTLMRMAWRLPHYEGAMRARAIQAQEQQSQTSPAQPPASASGAEWNPGLKSTLMADPALQGIFSFG